MNLGPFLKKYLLVAACSLIVMVILGRELIVGSLPPAGLIIALVILGLAGMVVMILVSKNAANQSGNASGNVLYEATRKRRLLAIRLGKTAIVVLVLLLLNGLRELRTGPVLPLLGGVAINIFITAVIVRLVVKLQKNLN